MTEKGVIMTLRINNVILESIMSLVVSNHVVVEVPVFIVINTFKRNRAYVSTIYGVTYEGLIGQA